MDADGMGSGVPRNRITLRGFIVGCPRSGTTLLQCLLAAHPRILSFPESHFFSKIMRLTNDQADQRLYAFIRAANLGCVQSHLTRRNHDAATYISAFVRLLDTAAMLQGRDIWIEKTPWHLHHIGTISHHVENARFIHILRNARDTIRSLHKVGRDFPESWKRTGSIEVCKRRWAIDVQASLQYMGDPTHHLVRYENLAAHPSDVLAELCGFLNAVYVESMNGRHAEIAPQLILPHELWKARVLGPVVSAPSSASLAEVPGALSDPIGRRVARAQEALDAALPIR